MIENKFFITDKTTENKPKDITFEWLVRENTGIHFLDSGGATGRYWQQPLTPRNEVNIDLEWCIKYNTLTASRPLYVFLEKIFKIDEEATREFWKWCENSEDYQFVSLEKFFAEKGFVLVRERDNTYNYEHDLDQDMEYVVYGVPGISDWFWEHPSKMVVGISTHNGADIRGGYSSVVICRFLDYPGQSGFFDRTVGWRVDKCYDRSEKTYISSEKIDREFAEWDWGYSNNPSYYVM